MNHREALQRAITAGRGQLDDRHEPLLELCRTLADQLDAAGPDASTRLTAAYLSALKDLGRALGTTGTKNTGRTSNLRQFRGVLKPTG